MPITTDLQWYNMFATKIGVYNMKNKNNIELHLDFTRARVLLSRIQTAEDLLAMWRVFGPCLEKYPSIEKINKRKNIS
jgi:hypothetical protein